METGCTPTWVMTVETIENEEESEAFACLAVLRVGNRTSGNVPIV